MDTDDLYPNVQISIKKIIEKVGYIRHKISKKTISAAGGNYLGALYEINIKGETREGNKKENNIFVKQVLPAGESLKCFSMSQIYGNEIFVYTELAKIFRELQNKANIPMEKRFKLVKIYDGSNIDALVFENIAKQGFNAYSRTDPMTLDYSELCVENLAKFHALSFVIESKMPEYFERKIKSLKHPVNVDADHKVFMNDIFKLTTRKLSPDLKMKVDEWWKTAGDDYSKYFQGTMTKVKCLCHGDFKTNNIMYKEMDGEIREVITLDYQFAHYGCPVLDLIYFICMGTDQRFRRKHMDHLKDLYHDSLRKHLEYFDVDVDGIYPKKIFEKDFENCSDHALVNCISILPFIMITQDHASDFNDYEKMVLGLKLNDTYYERLNGIFEDFFKWN